MDFGFFGDLLEEEAAPKPMVEATEGYRNIWVLVEHAGGLALPSTLEALGQARELADQIGVYAVGVILGATSGSLGQDLIACGADRVLVVDDHSLAEYQVELWTEALADLVRQYRPEALLIAGTPLGNDLAPHLAQRLSTGLLTHCTHLEIDMSERLLLCTYGIYGGEVTHTSACPRARPQMATLRPGYFRLPSADPHRSGSVQAASVDLGEASARVVWIGPSAPVDLPPPPLAKAKIVVAGGRGMGDAAGFALVQQLAAALGGVVAGSRGAFDEGWIAENQIVGVGGASIAPDLYIACGISGDVYHSFGIQDARFVVAVNSDPQAPIMKLANLAVVGDARRVLPALLEGLRA